VFLTPKMFVRIDAAIVYEREDAVGPPSRVGHAAVDRVGGTL
jgi:hypothetical protein